MVAEKNQSPSLYYYRCILATTLECNTQPCTKIIESILLIAHDVTAICRVTVVDGHVKSYAVGPWIPVESDLGRYMESPAVLPAHEYVVVIVEFGIARTQFYTCIRLEVGLNEAVAQQRTERQSKHLVLLVAVHRQGG